MSAPAPPDRIEAVRHFNRWYTQWVGALRGDLLASPFPLPQARILFELAHRDGITAADLAQSLGLDRSYLSRLLSGLERRKLVLRAHDKTDGRRRSLALSAAGRRAFDELDRRSRDEVRAILEPLAPEREKRLLGSMAAIERVLAPAPSGEVPFTLRAHEPGDLGWVVSRHGALYAREYGWDMTFEAMVAEIAAKFLKAFDPVRERAWIAERDGERVGCVFIVSESASVAKLRMLLVEPEARGLGLGRQLVAECIRFARSVGYREIVLWTNDILHAARKLYVDAGFQLVGEQRHTSFGHALVGQTWSLEL